MTFSLPVMPVTPVTPANAVRWPRILMKELGSVSSELYFP